MNITSQPHTVFKNEAAALLICADFEANEFRVLTDPKGSGRCIVEMLDEETGEALGKL
jgi:hypothetical protein